MTEISRRADTKNPQTELGQALRLAWWSYVRRLDTEMGAAGFDRRRFPMVYMFALYAEPGETTISQLGERFSISRQAASKIVAKLCELGYVTLTRSTTDRREKVVQLTPRAIEFVTARRGAAWSLDEEIRSRLGDDNFKQFRRMLKVVAEIAVNRTELESDQRMSVPDTLFRD
jgi:DNA-binding MarR family transcriptional regulator